MANNQVQEVKDKVMRELEKSKVAAQKEVAKVKKELEGAYKKVDDYVKKNPEKAAMISAGVGAALGAAIALLVGGKKKKKR